MRIVDLENKQDYNIELSKNSGIERLICPKCNHLKRNKKEKTLAWNHNEQIGFCHSGKCQTSFGVYKKFEKKEYKKPEWNNNTQLSDSVVKWFEDRGISQFTLRQNRITEGLEFMPQKGKEVNTIQFNYFRDDELVNIKYRTGDKKFKLFKDGELILYGLNDIKDKNQVIIVEGEIDKLSFYESGIHNCVSVPNGANTGSNKMEYIDNCIEYLDIDNVDEIIIATDNDLPGTNLRNQLASRLGLERCYKIELKDCKDANEYLKKYGKQSIVKLIEDKKPFPIDGIFTSNNFSDELDLLYSEGLKPGLQIDVPEFDKLISFEAGRLYTITGIPTHGKSEFLDFLLTKLNVLHDWKIGYFSPENHPLQLHASKIIEKISGSSFNKQYLSPFEYHECKDYINRNFYFIDPSNDYKLDTILSKARYLVFRHNIKVFVIDPYNKLEHHQEKGQSETNYISVFLDKLTNFAKRNNIAMVLVAHPTKMKKLPNGLHEIPTLYDINGSANFYNKTDFGISVYRNMISDFTEIYVQKVKFKHLGQIGMCQFKWNFQNGRYDYFDGMDVNNIIKDNNSWIKKEQQEIEPNNDFDLTQTDDVPF